MITNIRTYITITWDVFKAGNYSLQDKEGEI